MLRFALPCLMLGIGISLPALSAGEIEQERAKMAGQWKIVSFEVDGKEVRTAEELQQLLVTIDDEGKMTVQVGERTIVESTNKLDPTQKPKTMDQTYTNGGGGKGQTSLAIYELKKDTLKCCYGAPGDPRPTSFSSKGNSLVVYARQKAE